MKRRSVCLLLSTALVLSLAACTVTPNESPEPSMDAEASPTPIPSVNPAPNPLTVTEADVYESWQEAYAGFLRRLWQEEDPVRNWYQKATDEERDADPDRSTAYWQSSETYSLYDVDKDGIPELFVQYGLDITGRHTVCYTFRDGQVAEVGGIDSPYSRLYSWPDGNGLISFEETAGSATMDKYAMEGGCLTEPRMIFYQEIVNTGRSDFIQPVEAVPGSEAIPTYSTENMGSLGADGLVWEDFTATP